MRVSDATVNGMAASGIWLALDLRDERDARRRLVAAIEGESDASNAEEFGIACRERVDALAAAKALDAPEVPNAAG